MFFFLFFLKIATADLVNMTNIFTISTNLYCNNNQNIIIDLSFEAINSTTFVFLPMTCYDDFVKGVDREIIYPLMSVENKKKYTGQLSGNFGVLTYNNPNMMFATLFYGPNNVINYSQNYYCLDIPNNNLTIIICLIIVVGILVIICFYLMCEYFRWGRMRTSQIVPIPKPLIIPSETKIEVQT